MCKEAITEEALIDRINTVIAGLKSIEIRNKEYNHELLRDDGSNEEWSVGVAQQLLLDYRDKIQKEKDETPTYQMIDQIRDVINRNSRENASNTPDFVLGWFIIDALMAFERAIKNRDNWYGIEHRPGCSKIIDGRTPEEYFDHMDLSKDEITENLLPDQDFVGRSLKEDGYVLFNESGNEGE